MAESHFPIVLSINDRFAAPCGVVIASACATCVTPALLRFHVYSTDLSESSRRMLAALAEPHGASVTFHVSDASRVKHVPRMKNVSVDSHVRLLIPEDFPDEERILYLDADVLVLRDVLALQNVPLEDAIVAVAPNGPAPFIEDFNRIHGRPPGTPLFNAGVMLLQPRLWIEARIAERSVEWLIANEAKLIFRNQDALNILLQDRLRWLNAIWNVESRLYREWLLGYGPSSPLVDMAAVLHYTGGDKPWIPGRYVCWQSRYNRHLEDCRRAMRRTGGDVHRLPRRWTALDHVAAAANVAVVGARVRLGALKPTRPSDGTEAT